MNIMISCFGDVVDVEPIDSEVNKKDFFQSES